MTTIRFIHPPLQGRTMLAWPLLLAALLAAAAAPRPDRAWADDAPVFPPVAWKSYPNTESVEMGDHALNLNLNFGKPNDVVSATAHDLRSGVIGGGSGYSVLLRTSDDGQTRKLPPTNLTSAILSKVQVGLTPSSTIVQGAAPDGLRLTSQVTKPYLPSDTIDERNSRLSNAPFMYLRLQVDNTAATTAPAAAVYVGFGGSCAPPLDDWPRPGWQALAFCGDDDLGGTRYLAYPKTAGTSWGVGGATLADFAADGVLGGGSGGGNGAVALPVPPLAPGGSVQLDLVYGGWNQAAGLTAVDGSLDDFYYRTWWSGPAGMLAFAIEQTATAMAGAAAFDQQVRAVSSDSGSQYGAAHAFRGWRHGNWLVRRPDGTPLFAESEGAFNYLSTVDVAYEYHAFETRYEPWKARLELDEWRDHYETDAAGRKFMLHDLGKERRLTEGPAYDLKSGLRRHMPVEHNVDMVAMIFAWEDRTGQVYDRQLVVQLLEAAESHDSDQDGSIDTTEMAACLPSGRCRTSQLGTTYDGELSLASKVQAGNTILTAKLGVVESFAASRGYQRPSGESYAAAAGRHLERARAFAHQLSSDPTLAGYDATPGYLADALLYGPVLGRNPTLDAAVTGWLAGALAANQAAVLGGYAATAIARNSTAETFTWISKALDGDVVGAWIRRQWPTLAAATPEAPKLWAAWNKRTSGTAEGTFDFARYPSNRYLSAGWYPRAVVLWAAAPATAPAPRVG